ncbi:uncharacterized protein PAC_12977 [Phialocephala subalpina]|uniref:Uncharacterized protein n=1 Tax=Phialocephala subalpina TaxID=576137 RepID=A0A1L7XDF6_9HELO|nr:uncharacterized protein PAC_12977 [Phialocephala subalpina]
MSHNPQLDSTDDFVHINDNHSAQHKTHDSAYYSLAASTAKPLSSDLNDSNERNSRENGPIPSPSYPERRPGTSRAGNLTAPPPSRVNPLEDDGLYGLGHQCLNNGFLWPTPCWPNLSLSNLVQPPDIHSAFINTVPTTEAVPYELSLNTGNGPTTGDGEWQPNLPAFDNAQQQGETVAGPVPTDLERSTAAVWVNTWLGQFPGKWPSEETIIKLAALSELRPKIIEGALAGLLYSNATNCSQDHLVS